ncbi:MAG TPA: lipid-A-disaccharide synthase [Desulfuromonadales bacterium]|nr:lipid-A-disaccharide synthase [Desulfuromonadales bacterium]
MVEISGSLVEAGPDGGHSHAPKVLIVTGEDSGDLHGAKLIRSTLAKNPQVRFMGVGGQRMADAGCELLMRAEDLAVVGLVEVLGHFPKIWQAFQTLKGLLHDSGRPDALVLIDFPEFNLRLARQAQKAGVPVLYYVSPQVWAWRRGRVKKIARIVDRLAAIFPFEPDLYRGLDIQVEYVGHPLLDEFSGTPNRGEILERLQISEDTSVIGLFPGSRRSELKFMLQTLADAGKLIRDQRPGTRFLVPVAAGLSTADIAHCFSKDMDVHLLQPDEMTIYETARACDAVITVSGTVTLQIALAGTPMVIFYKLAPVSFAIGRKLIRVDHIGLANIVAGKRVVPEFIQGEATPQNLAAAALAIIDDQQRARQMRQELAALRQKLGKPGCSDRVADMLLDMVSRKH